MAQYQDFTYYRRFHFEKAVNIGFCADKNDSGPTAMESSALVYKLQRYIEHPLNVIRGGFPRTIVINGKSYTLGFAEMRVIGKDGTVYAAPNEMVTDIIEGRYQPPAEFVAAVMNGVDPDSQEYLDYCSRYDQEHYWGASDKEIQRINEVTALIQKGDRTALKAYHEQEPIMDIVTANGSVLCEAISNQNEDIAYWLLENGVSLEHFEGEELLAAINHGMEDHAIHLLSYEIPMIADSPADNPLFLAVAHRRNKIAVELYRNRKDLIRTYPVDGKADFNIYQWARRYKNMAFVRSTK